ncbi:hypothetical protein D1007_13207 [Hordeum vulgare]|nr:hypothetical protein D1007_13207 [Hordeum vulgare]
MNLHRITSALVRFIRKEIRRSARNHGIGVRRHWGSGNGRRGRRGHCGHHDHPGSAAAGPSNPPPAVHHAYQAPPMPAFVAPPPFVTPQMDWLLEDAGGIFCLVNRYGSCPPTPATLPPEQEMVGGPTYPYLPTPTPADEEPLAPPGYGPVPAMAEWKVTPMEAAEATAPTEATETGATIPASPSPSPRRAHGCHLWRLAGSFADSLQRWSGTAPASAPNPGPTLACTSLATTRRPPARPPPKACWREAPSGGGSCGIVEVGVERGELTPTASPPVPLIRSASGALMGLGQKDLLGRL